MACIAVAANGPGPGQNVSGFRDSQVATGVLSSDRINGYDLRHSRLRPRIAVSADEQKRPITELLVDLREGRAGAQERLIDAVHSELRRLAARQMSKERTGHTLQPTALVNEAYMRLFSSAEPDFRDQNAFYAAATQVMKGILIDWARRKGAIKRGGKRDREPLTDPASPERRAQEILDVDTALEGLRAADPELTRLVEFRFFGGLSVAQTAAALGCSGSTVDNRWKVAKKYLSQRLRSYGGWGTG